MKRFLLLYCGPPAPPNPTHEGWREWFAKIGDALVDVGSPVANGVAARADGSTSDDTGPVRGFSLIQADDRSAALELLRGHPLLAFSPEYRIEMFEVPSR